MYKAGEMVRLIDPGLPVSQDLQSFTDSKGDTFPVYWTELRKSFVGELGEVEQEPDEKGFMGVAFIRLCESDPFFTDKQVFTMHQEWFVSAVAKPQVCVCSINTLMARGCQCGQMERERGGD